MSERLTMQEKYLARRIVIDGQLTKIKRLVSELEAKPDLPASYEQLALVIDRLNAVITDLDSKVKR